MSEFEILKRAANHIERLQKANDILHDAINAIALKQDVVNPQHTAYAALAAYNSMMLGGTK